MSKVYGYSITKENEVHNHHIEHESDYVHDHGSDNEYQGTQNIHNNSQVNTKETINSNGNIFQFFSEKLIETKRKMIGDNFVLQFGVV